MLNTGAPADVRRCCALKGKGTAGEKTILIRDEWGEKRGEENGRWH